MATARFAYAKYWGLKGWLVEWEGPDSPPPDSQVLVPKFVDPGAYNPPKDLDTKVKPRDPDSTPNAPRSNDNLDGKWVPDSDSPSRAGSLVINGDTYQWLGFGRRIPGTDRVEEKVVDVDGAKKEGKFTAVGGVFLGLTENKDLYFKGKIDNNRIIGGWHYPDGSADKENQWIMKKPK